MSQLFEDLNDHIVFVKVKSRNEALKIKDDAKIVSNQKTVVVFFENRYHLYLAPMQDPYKIRKEVDDWINRDITTTPETLSTAIPENKSQTITKKKISKAK